MSRFLTLLILLSLLAIPASLPQYPSQAATTELFISEYIEGTSNNKALEIYNDTGAAINLATGGYDIQVFFNGNIGAGLTIVLTGSVADGDVYVVTNQSANAAILAQADQITSTTSWYNGDDAVVLRKNGVVIDALGQVGFDPGSEWGTGVVSTMDNTLRRKSTVCQGDPIATDAFDPSLEWDGYVVDTFSGLGAHTASCPDAPPALLINEVDADQATIDTAEFIELYDGGAGNTSLSGLALVFFNGDDDLSYAAYDLDGNSTDSRGYFVLCGSSTFVPNCDMLVSPATNLLQDGADAVALYTADASGFPTGTPATTANLLDALVYDTGEANDSGPAHPAQPLPAPGGRRRPRRRRESLQPALSERLRRSAQHPLVQPVFPHAGRRQHLRRGWTFWRLRRSGCPRAHRPGQRHLPAFTKAMSWWLRRLSSADFQDPTTGLGGFFLQEEDAQADADPLTSEGIFVYTSTVPVCNWATCCVCKGLWMSITR